MEQWFTWPRDRHRDLGATLALATAAQVVFACSFLFWTGGFGVHLTIAQSAWALSASTLATFAVPLPGMGVAVQQGALVYVLVQMGATPEQAAAITVCSLAMLLLYGGVGMMLEGIGILRTWRARGVPIVPRHDLSRDPT